jgi:signal transduction histidine kinase
LEAREGRLKYLNQTARQLHEEGVPFSPKDLDQHPLYTLSGELVESTDLPLLVAWRTGAPVQAQFVLSRNAGASWHLTWTAAPHRDSNGQVRGVVGSVTYGPPGRDLQRLAELAHDLRTPLVALQLVCPLVERYPHVDPELLKVLDATRAAAERAVQIAANLLECCRGPTGKGRGEVSCWFALEPFLSTLASEQTVSAQSKGLMLSTNFTELRGWEIYSDRVRFGRVLSNLLVNAVRYTPAGRIDFGASWRDDAGERRLALSVLDTGPGISEEEQESIFQPFERGKAGREGDSGGSGLGLAVVDRLVDELGLSMEVYSEYGRGSTFDLLIPAVLLRPAVPE